LCSGIYDGRTPVETLLATSREIRDGPNSPQFFFPMAERFPIKSFPQ
jgi:hypothetical protein